ncbi:hypothetical protein A2U01_0033128, partial [Trifolium medium]|nr:hypothetical protein [Trifolium medium]
MAPRTAIPGTDRVRAICHNVKATTKAISGVLSEIHHTL